MRPNSTLSDHGSESTMSSAFSSDSEQLEEANRINNNKQFFAKLVRDTRSKVEQKTLEINATVQEKLPEWKQRGAMYSTKAKETSMEWGRKGKEAVDRWKKDKDESPISPPIQQIRNENSIFGMKLENAVEITKIEKNDLVPGIVKRCIEYLDKVGIHEVGIYRIPGSTSMVNKLRSIFDKGSDIDFRVSQPDPHVVGTLLKMYLRELPEPIIPTHIANDPALATEDNPTVWKELQQKLPATHTQLLQLLFRHLKTIADHETQNRMTISNLALIFIPTLNMSRALFHCLISAGPKKQPPPLPQKPNLLLKESKRMIYHAKTMSDVLPPPKPSRLNKRTSPPVKPRSKSVSHEDPIFLKQTGRVEAIGKQFETLMSSKSSSFLKK